MKWYCEECGEFHEGHCIYCWKYGCGDCSCGKPVSQQKEPARTVDVLNFDD